MLASHTNEQRTSSPAGMRTEERRERAGDGRGLGFVDTQHRPMRTVSHGAFAEQWRILTSYPAVLFWNSFLWLHLSLLSQFILRFHFIPETQYLFMSSYQTSLSLFKKSHPHCLVSILDRWAFFTTPSQLLDRLAAGFMWASPIGWGGRGSTAIWQVREVWRDVPWNR